MSSKFVLILNVKIELWYSFFFFFKHLWVSKGNNNGGKKGGMYNITQENQRNIPAYIKLFRKKIIKK